jgi:hypothetical protein
MPAESRMNDSLETGLRHRLRRALRRTEAQHVKLRALLSELEGSLSAGKTGSIARQLARFCDALEAHFDLEDEVLFPALHGLHPPSKVALEALSSEHRLFLSELRGMLAAPSLDETTFARLRRALGEHERREEQLLESILGSDALRGD